MKKVISLSVAVLLLIALCACGRSGKKEKVLIYSGAEEYRNEYLRTRLIEQFPDYEITVESMPSGDMAAKLLAEGAASECDIAYDIEYGRAEKLKDALETLSYDLSGYVDEVVLPGEKVIPIYRNSGCIATNPAALASKGLPAPASYDDLLDPKYKGLISMPSPSSSGTGYMFLKSMVNTRGEDAAFAYFDALSKNILQYTSSGAGPVNALVQGEAAIGLAMTAQAVAEINKGVGLTITFFDEGSPFSLYGMGLVKGKGVREPVKKVFDFFYSTLIKEDNERFLPEKMFKNEDFTIKNYPSDIKYADMSNNTAAEKERLLLKWNH